MKYYGHYTHEELDELYPFERDIYLSLLKETKEKEANKNKEQ